MKVISKILEEVESGDYSKVEPLLHFIRSRGDIAESIDEAWEEETQETLNYKEHKTYPKIIKADKSEEEFNQDKLVNSVNKAVKSIGGDDKDLANKVLNQINGYVRGKDYVLTKDLKNEVIKTLASLESSEVARAYMLYVKEDYRQRQKSKVYTPEPIDPSMCGT